MTTIERERVETEREQRARALEAAALEIELRGWTSCQLMDADGRVCAMGALICALGQELRPDVTPQPFADTDYAIDFDPVRDTWGRAQHDADPMRWNDTHARDAADVCFVLRWRAEEIRDGLA